MLRYLQEPDAMLPMTEHTWGHPENWIGSQPGNKIMSLMSAYESDMYGADLPPEANPFP